MCIRDRDYILPNGLIVYTETKSGKRQEYSGSDNHELNIPMAVLVNGNSASASEICLLYTSRCV